MELVLVERKSSKIDKLVRQNFGPHEDLWDPKYFDMLFRLSHRGSTDPLAVCTLQWTLDYWILGDLCVGQKRQGFATEIVNRIMDVVKGPIWVDANAISSKIFEKDPRFHETTMGPWRPEHRAFMSS
jgi:hypothetical protein